MSGFRMIYHLAFLKKQGMKGFICFLVSLGVISQASDYVTLVYNPTDSLPYRLFLQVKQVTPKRGHYTCFEAPWYGRRVIKQVVGMAGDALVYDEEGSLWIETIEDASLRVEPIRDASLWVGRALKIGKQKKQAKDGRLLSPVKPGVIPEGKVFVLGDHERSFDSRYEELGLIPETVLQGRLIALV